jgi:hypothetical protein
LLPVLELPESLVAGAAVVAAVVASAASVVEAASVVAAVVVSLLLLLLSLLPPHEVSDTDAERTAASTNANFFILPIFLSSKINIIFYNLFGYDFYILIILFINVNAFGIIGI